MKNKAAKTTNTQGTSNVDELLLISDSLRFKGKTK